MFSLNPLNITCSHTSCFSSQSCLKPHTHVFLPQPGNSMAISEITLNGSRSKVLSGVCWRDPFKSLGSGTICCFSFHPSKAQAQRRSYPCQVALPLWLLPLSPFPVKGKGALEVPSLPLAGLKFLHLASLEPLTLLPFHQSSHPTFPNTMVRQPKCLPDEERIFKRAFHASDLETGCDPLT